MAKVITIEWKYRFSHNYLKIFFFWKFLDGHMSFYEAPNTPLLNFWWGLLWAALFAFGRDVCDVCSLRFTSGVTPAELLTASMVASYCFPHICVSAEVRCWILIGVLPHSSLTSNRPHLFEYYVSLWNKIVFSCLWFRDENSKSRKNCQNDAKLPLK